MTVEYQLASYWGPGEPVAEGDYYVHYGSVAGRREPPTRLGAGELHVEFLPALSGHQSAEDLQGYLQTFRPLKRQAFLDPNGSYTLIQGAHGLTARLEAIGAWRRVIHAVTAVPEDDERLNDILELHRTTASQEWGRIISVDEHGPYRFVAREFLVSPRGELRWG